MTTAAQERLVEVEAVEVSGGERAPVGAEKAFRPYDPDQVLLMAPVLRDWVPDGDLAHFVADLVDSGALDLSAIYADYAEERGFPPYDPRLMVKLLVYGYAIGVTSSRKLERASYRDVAVRMLCADQHPDFRSIARFRRRHLAALGDLFVQALRLCRQAELVGLGVLAVDGTKLRANASRHKAMSYERMLDKESELEDEIAALREQVDALLADAQATDQAEDAEMAPIGAATSCPTSFSVARSDWRASARPRRRWRPRRGRPRKPGARRWPSRARGRAAIQRAGPVCAQAQGAAQLHRPRSRIMKTSDGAFHQCYNGQPIVDSVTQVIVACDAFDLRPTRSCWSRCSTSWRTTCSDRRRAARRRGAAGRRGLPVRAQPADHRRHGLDAHLAPGRVKHSDPPRRSAAVAGRHRGQLMARKLTERPAPRSTRDARRSSNPSSARCRPSRTRASSGCAASPPPAPNIASKAPCTTSSSCTATAAWRSSPPDERPRTLATAPKHPRRQVIRAHQRRDPDRP